MATKKVQDFFKNKVSIRLKTGHQFKGLMSRVDNKNGIIILEDIEDMGNAYDKQQLPHDKKIAEKAFEAENIQEIILNDKIFADPKKYKRDDFFDSMTEHKQPKFRDNRQQKGQREFKPRGGHRGGRGGRGGDYRDNRDRDNKDYRDNRDNRDYKDNRDNRDKKDREYKPKRNQEKQQKTEQQDERDYR